jgi:hypothetical protein
MASIAHLHAETSMLTVDRHLKLLCSQLLASTLRRSHVSHSVVTSPPGPRAMKQTLFSKSIGSVEKYLTDGILLEVNYKRILESLHTDAVPAEICEAAPNKLLGVLPPGIHPSEETLLRSHRCALSQLRSDYCQRLKSYQFSIGKAEDDVCPECGTGSQNPNHLFDCPSFPTDLSKRDLWSNLREAAVFISNLPSFVHHLPPVPPLPFPHPGRPP